MAKGRMLRTASEWLRSHAPLAALITVLATLVLQTVVSTVLQWSNALLIFAVVILSLLTILYLQEIKSYITKYLDSQPYVYLIARTKDEIEQQFKKNMDAVEKANKCIYVLGADITRTPQGKQPAARRDYLATIENIVRTKVERGQKFNYERIVQSTPELITNELTSDHVDKDTFIHCRKVAEITRDSDEVDFKLYIRKPIAACPGILVIDEEYVSLAIVGDNKEYDTKADEYKYSRSIQAVVLITDHTKTVPDHYIDLFNKFANHEKEIVKYDPNAYR